MKKIILLLLMFVCLYSNAQTTCNTAQPFCAGGTSGVTFPASTNQPDAFPTSYNCLGSTPNPAWYYLQVSTSGNIDLYIAGTGNQDVDFICWGPFTTFSTICNNLSSTTNVVDCSYSSSPTETCNIVGAIAGQYYMVLITNFSNVVQNIQFNQIGGTGSTNCGLLASNSSICAGASATITANNASNLTSPSYSLNPGALTSPTPTFIVSPTSTTTYTIYVTGLNTSSVSVTQTAVSTVTVKPSPATVPTVTQTSCTNTVNAFNLGLTFTPASPVPGYTVNWSTIPFSVVSPTQTSGTGGIAAGIYNATITAAGGCSTTTSFSINPTPAPAVFNLVPGSSSYTITCAQPTVVINANPASYSYTWTNVISPPQTGPTGTFSSPGGIGTWSVIAVNPISGCTSTQTFVVSQNVTVPTSTVSPLTQNITCNIASIITVTGTSTPTTNITHQWISPSGGTLTAASPTAIFLPGGPGTYTHCIVNNINGCSSCSTFSVFSGAGFPTFSVSSPSQFTIGCGTTSLTTINISSVTTVPLPGGPVSYTVLPPTYVGPTYTLGGSSTYTANIPGQYTVIVHDNTNSCETTVQVSIISNTFAPQITATAVTKTLTCDVPKTVIQGFSGTPNTSFSWAFPGPPAGQVPNDTLTVSTNTASPTSTIVGTYTLTVTDAINKCKSTQTLTIYQNTAKPTAIITGSNAISCDTPTINFTNASTSNVPATFFPTLPVIGYIWSGPSPQQTQQVTSTYIAYTPAGIANQYTLVAKDLNNGCTSVATKTLGDNRVYPIVNTPLQPGPFILDCGVNTTATISPLITGTTTGFTYSWVAVPTTSFSSYTSSVTTVNKPGPYKIIVTNTVNGCQSYGVVEVINGGITGDFLPSTYTGYAPLNVSFTNLSASSSTATGASSITSVWSFGNGQSQITTSTSISPVTTYSNAGTYTVTMYVVKGACLDTVYKVIKVELPSKLEVPNVFTPNGDGSNDVFFLKVANVAEINAIIFDRWGNKVYESNSTTGNIEWDGKSSAGKELPAGTYFYIIKATGKDDRTYDQKGNVSIYR
ncbi:MAG: gliding motility-associated C-terminal domain-containing protein [Bacteroidia bacterium]|nr:gliding motility-associated C-terminal domain-containing protein [Bacteroidia bacterium]